MTYDSSNRLSTVTDPESLMWENHAETIMDRQFVAVKAAQRGLTIVEELVLSPEKSSNA